LFGVEIPRLIVFIIGMPLYISALWLFIKEKARKRHSSAF